MSMVSSFMDKVRLRACFKDTLLKGLGSYSTWAETI